MNEIRENIDEYILTVENDYFSEHIHISEDIKIVPIRIEKVFNESEEDGDLKKLPPILSEEKIKISIKKNCYCGYILYEI